MSTDHTLDGRVAVVSGASSGIGASIVRRLLRSGATVHGFARREAELASIDPEAMAQGRLYVHTLDVSNVSRLEATVATILAVHPVDVLVCAAGTNIPDRQFHQLSYNSFDEVMKTNLYGVFNLMRVTMDSLREQQGDIVIISSIAGTWPDHTGAAYGASKSALLGLARGASRDEHAHGVRVCTILPGIVDTPILDRRPNPPPREVRDWAIHPDDIAEAVHLAVSLPPRTNIAEISVTATRLQSLGFTQVATPVLPEGLA